MTVADHEEGRSYHDRHAGRPFWDSDARVPARPGAPDAAPFHVSLELTNEDVLTSPLLPGFELALRSLF